THYFFNSLFQSVFKPTKTHDFRIQSVRTPPSTSATTINRPPIASLAGRMLTDRDRPRSQQAPPQQNRSRRNKPGLPQQNRPRRNKTGLPLWAAAPDIQTPIQSPVSVFF
ncbi:MAG: hypothetical protein J5872_03565, partial [Lachnospiraceae bacterium]|nr:hypothetical protein [Lachnospiraceae bacterium]